MVVYGYAGVLGGGISNSVDGDYGTILGGTSNEVSDYSAIVGGNSNTVTAQVILIV